MLKSHLAAVATTAAAVAGGGGKMLLGPFFTPAGKNIGATFCIGREIRCVPYPGLKKKKKNCVAEAVLQSPLPIDYLSE